MSEVRRLSVSALTRVEGQGALRVRLVDGRVEIAEFNIYEPPRFFEQLLRGRHLHEVPDIVARICGLCPVAYQLTACRALEKALGVDVTPGIRLLRRLLYWGEWIHSHALHVHLLHAPDFLGFDDGFALAREHPGFVERGFRLQAVGRRILEVIGGRAVHPVNVAVGGFHRPPQGAAIRGLVPDLEWAVGAACELVEEVSRFTMPTFRQTADYVALESHGEYPIDEGRIVSSGAAAAAPLDIAVEEYPRHFQERQVSWSTALHSLRSPSGTPYLTGPQARINLCLADLPPIARRTAEACGIAFPVENPFQGIVVRSLEILAACEESLGIARACMADVSPGRVDVEPGAGVGCHATEAPRGLLYHRYEIDADGLVVGATIIPPTAQNQAQLEADLRTLLPTVGDVNDAEATRWCERLVRSYDPCISCATHFLDVSITRGPEPAAGAR